ncbi:hypothetical protein [Pseudomonas nicosulfuronedens]
MEWEKPHSNLCEVQALFRRPKMPVTHDISYLSPRDRKLRAAYLLLGIFISNTSPAAISTEGFCFHSTEKEIQLEFRTFFERESRWRGGYVKYSTSNAAIPIILKSTEESYSTSDSPADSTSTWIEIDNGEISGEYEISSQGVNVYDFNYTKRKNGKKYYFTLDPNIDFSIESGCRWTENH